MFLRQEEALLASLLLRTQIPSCEIKEANCIADVMYPFVLKVIWLCQTRGLGPIAKWAGLGHGRAIAEKFVMAWCNTVYFFSGRSRSTVTYDPVPVAPLPSRAMRATRLARSISLLCGLAASGQLCAAPSAPRQQLRDPRRGCATSSRSGATVTSSAIEGRVDDVANVCDPAGDACVRRGHTLFPYAQYLVPIGTKGPAAATAAAQSCACAAR